MTGDIVFLLIFVILPTALIVSGIWLILFIRREPEARVIERPEPAQRSAATETEQVSAIQSDPEREIADLPGWASDSDEPDGLPGEPAVAVPAREADFVGPVREFDPESDQDALQELSPLAADLLYDDTGRDQEALVDDSRLMELLEPGDRELMEGQMAGDEPDLDETSVEQTEEIPGVPPADREPVVAVDPTRDLPEVGSHDTDSEWRPRAAADDESLDSEDVESEKVQTDQLAEDDQSPEPDDGEGPFDDDQPGEGDDDDADQRQRQPGVRLLPTGEAERRRGRTSGRRVPPIGRLNRRDESRVESGDGPPDVSSGYSE